MDDDAMQADANEEQILYARILAAGMYAGLGLLLVSFFLYLTGILEPVVPIDRLPEVWTLSVHEYLEVVNEQYVHSEHALTGWWWLSALHRGDFLNLLGIAVLALVTIVCFLGIVPTLLRKGDRVYATIAIVEAAILALAASGVLTAGH